MAKTIGKIVGKLLLLGIILVFLSSVGNIIFIMLNIPPEQVMIQSIYLQLTMIIQNILFIAGTAFMYHLFEKKDSFSLGWKQHNWVQKLTTGTSHGFILITLSFLLIWLSGNLNILSLELNFAVLRELFLGIIVFFAVAIGEEYLTRGYIQGLLKNNLGPIPAILGTSLIFAVLHIFNAHLLQSPIPILVLFIAGILLGLSREVSGGLWMPIGIHFSWNFFMGNIYGIPVSGHQIIENPVITSQADGPHLLSGGDFGLEGSILLLIVILIYTGYLFYHWQQKSPKKL